MINDILIRKGITMYKLSKLSGVPYTTINDICSGRTSLAKCSLETVWRISKALDVTIEELIEPYVLERSDFEIFKSSVCHRLKAVGDIEFMISTLENNDIRVFYDRKWYRESFYLLAMLDYLSRINDIPFCLDYEDIRCGKLDKPLYPAGVMSLASVNDREEVLSAAENAAIPEFMRFNIVECEVRDVV